MEVLRVARSVACTGMLLMGAVPAARAQAADDHSFNLSARVQLDAAFVDQDRTPMGNAQELRRAYMTASGSTAKKNWRYLLAVNLGPSVGLNTAELSYVGFDDLQLSVGYFKAPFSLEYQTSNSYTLLQERSLLHDAFDPPKRIGAGATLDKDWGASELTAAVGVFGMTIPNDVPPDGSSGAGVTGRVTYAFSHTQRRLLHVGAGAERRASGNGEVAQLQARPGVHVAPRLVDTGAILDVDHHLTLGAELAGVAGPFSLQGEFMAQQLSRRTSGNLVFHGWYAQVGYFLTDDSHAPAYSGGEFGEVRPRGKRGAWQLALRFDTVDLSDVDFIGGAETDLTAGLNWYLNESVRLSMNYVSVRDLDRPGHAHDDDRPNMLVTRVWLHF